MSHSLPILTYHILIEVNSIKLLQFNFIFTNLQFNLQNQFETFKLNFKTYKIKKFGYLKKYPSNTKDLL